MERPWLRGALVGQSPSSLLADLHWAGSRELKSYTPKSVHNSRSSSTWLSTQTKAHHAAIDALQGRAAQVSARVEAVDVRATEGRTRIAELERRAELDRSLIADLQADSLASKEHAANMEESLRTSRRIGAAVGVVMSRHNVGEADAFELLRRASMDRPKTPGPG